MSRFELHWSVVDPPACRLFAAPGCTVLALWPAPVNLDACFEAAGFRDFDDNDAEWDSKTSELVSRVVRQLSVHGEPRLESAPLLGDVPWYLRPFQTGQPLPLLEQIEQPMHWDSLPTCHVAFGRSGAALRAGSGHILLWVTLPDHPECTPQWFVEQVSNGASLHETRLDWKHLAVVY